MATHEQAMDWLAQQGNYPSEPINTSRYYPASESSENVASWWFEFDEDVSDKESGICVHLLCEDRPGSRQFHHLVIPCSFIRTHRDELGFRDDKGKYSLIISAEEHNRFQELRGAGKLDLSQFMKTYEDRDE